ncbi:KR domain-containing protein [Streptacidiphilus sp. 4-A2]|nr:KR domain-containing protein [Streptacidiphilus sp. 4-A2]
MGRPDRPAGGSGRTRRPRPARRRTAGGGPGLRRGPGGDPGRGSAGPTPAARAPAADRRPLAAGRQRAGDRRYRRRRRACGPLADRTGHGPAGAVQPLRPGAPGAVALAAELAGAGTPVAVVAGDVGDRAQVAGLVAWIDAGGPRLSSVMHAAGAGLGGPVDGLTAADLADVSQAKAGGAAHLDEATAGLGLDAFVLFSSGAAAWGSGQLSGYAAANAALDALVEDRRARGLAGTSIAWGLWGGGGMGAARPVGAPAARPARDGPGTGDRRAWPGPCRTSPLRGLRHRLGPVRAGVHRGRAQPAAGRPARRPRALHEADAADGPPRRPARPGAAAARPDQPADQDPGGAGPGRGAAVLGPPPPRPSRPRGRSRTSASTRSRSTCATG